MTRRIAATLFAGLVYSATAFGQFTPISSPDSTYTGSTTLVPITQSNGTSVTSLTNGTQTISLSTAISAQTVPGGGWSTWSSPPNSETATPRVLARYSSLTTFTITLSPPQYTFGFEAEPDTFAAFTFSADFMSGATVLGTITLTINGSAGSRLFAASSSTPISSVVLTTPTGANGFGLAQFRVGTAGAPTALGAPALNLPVMSGLGILLAAAGALLAQRQNLSHGRYRGL